MLERAKVNGYEPNDFGGFRYTLHTTSAEAYEEKYSSLAHFAVKFASFPDMEDEVAASLRVKNLVIASSSTKHPAYTSSKECYWNNSDTEHSGNSAI